MTEVSTSTTLFSSLKRKGSWRKQVLVQWKSAAHFSCLYRAWSSECCFRLCMGYTPNKREFMCHARQINSLKYNSITESHSHRWEYASTPVLPGQLAASGKKGSAIKFIFVILLAKTHIQSLPWKEQHDTNDGFFPMKSDFLSIQQLVLLRGIQVMLWNISWQVVFD